MRTLGTILLKPFPFLGSHVGRPRSFTALPGPLPPGPQPLWQESCISCLSYIAVRLFLNIVACNFMAQDKKQCDLPWFQVPRFLHSLLPGVPGPLLLMSPGLSGKGCPHLPRATTAALVFPHLLLPHHDGPVDRVLSVLWFFWNRLRLLHSIRQRALETSGNGTCSGIPAPWTSCGIWTVFLISASLRPLYIVLIAIHSEHSRNAHKIFYPSSGTK